MSLFLTLFSVDLRNICSGGTGRLQENRGGVMLGIQTAEVSFFFDRKRFDFLFTSCHVFLLYLLCRLLAPRSFERRDTGRGANVEFKSPFTTTACLLLLNFVCPFNTNCTDL